MEEGELAEEREHPTKKFSPCERVKEVLVQADLRPLRNDKRRRVMNTFPIPACDEAHPPKLDEAVSYLIPKYATSYDSYLSKLQRFAMDAMGPLIWLANEREQGRACDVDGVIQQVFLC